MKKHLLVVIALVALVGFVPTKSTAQTGNNVLVEYITGTWCGYCPCGHVILDNTVAAFPTTVVLAYHGASSDPWQSYTTGIRLALFGSSQSYPTAVIGRKTGVLSRSAWYNNVGNQTGLDSPGVSIVLNNKQYNSGTRTITGSIAVTSLKQLTGSFYINFVLTEDNLVYPQNYYASCGVAGYHNDYVHDHVVKAMINGDLGTLLSTTDDWSPGTTVNVPLNYTLPVDVVPQNCKVNIFVYQESGSLNSSSYVQQAMTESVTGLTGISNLNEVPEIYSLEQNYPNPFNPTTNISFSIPNDGNTSLKFYNNMGQEIATYVEGFLKAGTYKAEFDGSKLASGVYYYTLKTDNFTQTKKMILIK